MPGGARRDLGWSEGVVDLQSVSSNDSVSCGVVKYIFSQV